jgi:DMSO/TMAO reductase YedYZ heme-binding membrane subunit
MCLTLRGRARTKLFGSHNKGSRLRFRFQEIQHFKITFLDSSLRRDPSGALPAFTNQLGANPVERLLQVSGEIAIWTLGAVLSLSPLRVLFPRSAIVNALNRHRRYIGVSACIYGLLHLSCHVLYQGDCQDLLQSFTKPFTWFGLAGLSTLVLPPLTNNNWSVRRLGGKRWKLLHRLASCPSPVMRFA